MNEQELAGKIVQHLEQGLGDIKQGTLYQLQSARMAALDRYRVTQPVFGMAWASDAAFHISHSRYFNARNLVMLATLLLSLIGFSYWQAAIQPSNEIADIDVNLLTGDLPISAYLDSDFDAWLKRSSQ
jgi:hypothetical protein